ncbi:MAG: acyl-CoA dehydrogenase family protein [Advenella sp.]
MNAVTEPLDNPVTYLCQRVKQFVDTQIIPKETALLAGDDNARQIAAALSAQARQAGLFGSFYPKGHGGIVNRLSDYLPIAEQEGRSEFGPAIMGADATLDAHMLFWHGSPVVRARYFDPLVQGRAVCSYAMSEPDSIGSIPDTMQTRARWQDSHWVLTGKKWFVCRSLHADFITVVARTSDKPVEQGLSMLIVPADAPGFEVLRELPVLGRMQGQGELSFTNVVVPSDHVLGVPGQGIKLMQQRLGLGRILRASQWLGMAQRSFELMCERIHSERGVQARLVEKQLVRARVCNVYRHIATARALLRDAARKFDDRQANSIEVNIAKLAASDALSVATDNAIQIMGAEGLSDGTPLSSLYRNARTTHILDGTDDALVSSVGRALLANSRNPELFDSDYPSVVNRASNHG